MKKYLVSVFMMLSFASFASSVLPWDKPLVVTSAILDPTEYYWFDSGGNYIGQNTINDEIWITGFSEATYNPKTLQEKGYAPNNVTIAPPADPEPIWFPDKVLYSHP